MEVADDAPAGNDRCSAAVSSRRFSAPYRNPLIPPFSVIWKEKKIDVLRLRAYKSRATIPGPPKTPGTAEGDPAGTCSPVAVGAGIVSVGLNTLKNSHAKLCTARIARNPQR